MEKFYNETLEKLETDIKELEMEADSSIQQVETVIRLIIKCLVRFPIIRPMDLELQ